MFNPKPALEHARKELLRLAGELRDERDSLPAREIEFEEEAELVREDTLSERLDEQTREQLAEIELALEKVSAGTYGLCEACSGRIGRQRLKAWPQARLCLSCAELYEARGQHLPSAATVME